MKVAIGVVTIALLALTACGGTAVNGEQGAKEMQSTGPANGALIVATGLDTQASNLAFMEGKLRGRVNSDGTACFWLDIAPKVAILWPHGSVGHNHPLRVLDDQGRAMGVVGSMVKIAGGAFEPPRPLAGCPEFTQAFG